MRRLTKAAWAVVLCGLLTGCTVDDTPSADPGPTPAAEVTMPVPRTGEIVLLDRTAAFVAYDPETGAVGQQSNVDDYFAYEFATQTGQITVGNSTRGGFTAMRRDGDNWVEEAEAPEGQRLFPLATDGDRTFYVRQAVDESTPRSIVQLVDGKLKPVTDTETSRRLGAVLSGALLGDLLYVTSYVEAKGIFELRVLEPGARDVGRTLTLQTATLVGDPLLSDGKRVWGLTKSGFRVVAGEAGPPIACRGQCSIVPGRDLMLDWRPGPSGLAGSRLAVVETRTGQQRRLLKNVVDFRVDGDRLITHGPRGRTVKRFSAL